VDKSIAPGALKIAVIGGGTGSFTMLSALKAHTEHLSAIVNMVDDGGSTGVLRDELGVLPPGDVRQCLVALSDSSKLRELFNYRFEEGTFGGHSFGNILLTALEKVSGDFRGAVDTASEILQIKGKVVPVTFDNVRLRMEWPDTKVILNGERVIDAHYFRYDPRRAKLSLVPSAKANPEAVAAIEDADVVVIAPGDLYTSLGPLLIIDEIAAALKRTKAKCIYVSNLVTKDGQTAGFKVSDHANEIERFVGGSFLDYVLYNKQQPDESAIHRYEAEKAYLVQADEDALFKANYTAIAGNFLGNIASENGVDRLLPVTRSLIRHDTEAIARAIISLCGKNN